MLTGKYAVVVITERKCADCHNLHAIEHLRIPDHTLSFMETKPFPVNTSQNPPNKRSRLRMSSIPGEWRRT